MKWTIFYNGAVIIGINFADGAYKKTPTLLRIERVSGSGDISISYDALNFSAIYVFDTNDKLSIDISDIIRIAEINQSGTINVTYDGLVIEIPFVVAGFVAPADVFIPKFNRNWLNSPSVSDLVVAAIPNRLIASPFSNSPNEIIELYAKGIENFRDLWVEFGVFIESIFNGVNGVDINAGIKVFFIKSSQDRKGIKFVKQNPLCGRDYAVVRWQSRFGGYKCHVWELVNFSEEVSDKTEFKTFDNSYKVTKGVGSSFQLKIDELTQFDYWYYCDIITSDDVRIWIGNDTFGGFSEDMRVNVTKSKYTLPTSAEKAELVVDVEWKKYAQI